MASDSRLVERIQYTTVEDSNNQQKEKLASNIASHEVVQSNVTTSYEKSDLRLELSSVAGDESYSLEANENNDKPQNVVTIHTPGSVEGSTITPCENSDSGSIISMSSSFNDISSIKGSKADDGDNSSVKSKKRRSFFNFRRSKKDTKKEVIL